MSDDDTERRAELLDQIRGLRKELRDHIAEEMPVIRAIIYELGTAEQIRERRVFIELLLDRERDRRKLRFAIIKHGTVLALVAVTVFVLRATWNEIGEVLKSMIGRRY